MAIQETQLREFRGTEHYHRLFGNIFVTDGVRYIAENGGKDGADWLLVAIASYQCELCNDPELTHYQFWRLEVEDNKGVLTCRADWDREPAVSQKFAYTDFDLPKIDFYCCATTLAGRPAMVICLPSEY